MPLKVRIKDKNENIMEGILGEAVLSSPDEYIIYFEDDVDCISFSNILQFKIDEMWYDKQYALDKNLIIPNNANTNYDVPHSAIEKLWGYNLL